MERAEDLQAVGLLRSKKADLKKNKAHVLSIVHFLYRHLGFGGAGFSHLLLYIHTFYVLHHAAAFPFLVAEQRLRSYSSCILSVYKSVYIAHNMEAHKAYRHKNTQRSFSHK